MYIQNTNNNQYAPLFTAMKSSAFTGVDYACMRKFKAPIEKFNSISDFYMWAEKNFYKLASSKIEGRNSIITKERKKILAIWTKFLSENNNLFSPSLVLLAYNSILKNLKPDNENIPPELNQDIFVKTVDNLEADLEKDKNYKFDLDKIYRKNLAESFLGEKKSGYWLIIPSQKNDEKNYEKNLEKLKSCSYRTWCTKNIKAEDYLKEGDVHIYFENNNPKIGIRFRGERIEDISGVKNDGKIPLEYFDIVKNHIQENNYKIGFEANCQLESAEALREKIRQIKSDLGEAIKNKNTFKILDYFGFKPILLPNGSISIANYRTLNYFLFEDLGINENDLFKKISEIRGHAYFRKTGVTNLGSLNKILGDVNFADSQVRDLGKLETIEGSAFFSDSKITNIKNLKMVKGFIYIQKALINPDDLKNVSTTKIIS